MKQKTPLLRPLRQKGATMYVFPSATEDIGLNLNSRASGVALSHYALLNIPAFECTSSNPDIEIAEELQNYVMNFETLLLNQETYNYQDYHTVSERVFWHWLNSKKDFVRFTKQDNYIKEDYSDNKDRTVVCFGSIDAGNSLSTEFGIFNETYINIPTSYGDGPVFFKQVTDSNCTSKVYSIDNIKKLEGRDENPSGKYLSNSAPVCDTGSAYNMMGQFDNVEIIKSIDEIQEILRKQKNDININSFDDINIKIDQLSDNTIELSDSFNFNAILLYYSIYDQDDTTKSPYAVNLFGIIFLDGPQKATAGDNTYYIETFNKKKSTDSYFGNSYSFRVNIKTMSVYDNSDAIINDNTTLSSVTSFDFSDVISNLNRAIDTMNTNVHSTIAIQDNYMKILTYYDEQKRNIEDISTKINSLYIGNKTNKINASTLMSNEITPSDTSAIMISVDKEYNDFTDSVSNEKYTAPIVIQNNHNIPAMYYPQVSLTDEFTVQNDITETERNIRTADVIKNINVSWYTNGNSKSRTSDTFVYPILNINPDIVNENKITDLVDSSSNINYNLLTNILVDYVKELETPELDETQLNKIIDSINISEYINNNDTIKNMSVDVTNLKEQINNLKTQHIIDVSTLYNMIFSHGGTGGTGGSTDLTTFLTELTNLSQTVNTNHTYSIDISNNVASLKTDITNINNTITKHDTSIRTIIQSLTDTNNHISEIEDTLSAIYTAINSHTDSLKKVKDVLNDINEKLKDKLAWKDQ